MIAIAPVDAEPTAAAAVLWPRDGWVADRFVVIAKQSFRMGRVLEEITPRALRGDPRVHGKDALNALPNDFLWRRRRTDVIVTGVARSSRPAAVHRLHVSVGPLSKEVAVVGDRTAYVRRGRVTFDGPAEFEAIPLEHRRTYGGVDPRVERTDEAFPDDEANGEAPGSYPRNPFGCGYVVVDGDCEVRLPNFEDPQQRLAPATLVTGSPEVWWRQPLPWTTLPMLPGVFPRCAYIRHVALHVETPVDASLPEAKRRLLPEPLGRWTDDAIATGFYSEASLGLALRAFPPAAPVVLSGFGYPCERYRFGAPPIPTLTVVWERSRWSVAPRATSVVCDTEAGVLDVVWVGECELDRWIPNPSLSSEPARVFVNGGEVST